MNSVQLNPKVVQNIIFHFDQLIYLFYRFNSYYNLYVFNVVAVKTTCLYCK